MATYIGVYTMVNDNEINALKAQVNCLRKAALDAISFMSVGEGND